jgi:putative transposase
MNTTCPHQTNYPTDMHDAEWAIIAPYVNQDPKIGSPRTVCMRCVVNAIFYLNRSGWTQRVPRNRLPKDFPNYGTVFYHYRKWTHDGTWERINTDLRRLVREKAGRDPEPSLAIVDSQTVKTTEVGGESGFDGNKQINGRKRHILVDTVGLLLLVVVTTAALQDANRAAVLGARLTGKLPRLKKYLQTLGTKARLSPGSGRHFTGLLK